MRCGDARVGEADSDDRLTEMLPRVQREIDEEPRPPVRHAFDGHPFTATTDEAVADRQAELGSPVARLGVKKASKA